MNLIVIAGNVGKDPEFRTTPSGMVVCKLSVATSRKYKGEEQTQWHRVIAFDKLAELIRNHVGKGDKVGFEGRMEYGSYEKDGTTMYTAEIIANQIHFLGGGKRKDSLATGGYDDDLPNF